jgi:hypothetical protein
MRIVFKFLFVHLVGILFLNPKGRTMVVSVNLLFGSEKLSHNFLVSRHTFCCITGEVNKILYIGFKSFDKGSLKELSV